MTALDRLKEMLATESPEVLQLLVERADAQQLVEALATHALVPPTSTNVEVYTRKEVRDLPAGNITEVDSFRLLATVEAHDYWKWRSVDHALDRSRDLFVLSKMTQEQKELRQRLTDAEKTAVARQNTIYEMQSKFAELKTQREADAAELARLRRERELMPSLATIKATERDATEFKIGMRQAQERYTPLLRTNGELRRHVDQLTGQLQRLRDRAMFLLSKCSPFSTDPQADSCMRADMQRELGVMADPRRRES